jgi:hypothetical protein
MNPMTPRGLMQRIRATNLYQRKLAALNLWNPDAVWYQSQKEHWLGWLAEYDGPAAYNRKTYGGRSDEYVYNHINCPPMLLYLAEAAGVPRSRLSAAVRSALAAPGTQPATVRRFARNFLGRKSTIG